jgi:glycosyltransferase 2 family protein
VKVLWRIVKVGIGVALLAWLLAGVDFKELTDIARQGDPGLLALGLSMMVLSLPVFQAWRLHVLIDTYTQTWATTMRVFFVGAFFNNVLPSNVGGDAVRLVYLQRMRGGNWGAPLALLMLHRLSGIGVILAIAVAYLAFAGDRTIEALGGISVDSHALWIVIWAVAIAGLLGVAALFLPGALRAKVVGRAQKFLGDFITGWREVSRPAMIWLLVLTVGFHATRLLGFLYVVRYMGQDVGIGELIIVMAVTAVLALVPVTVGALGVMEGSITLMLGAYGVSHPAAVAVALANRMVLLLSALVGGFVYINERRISPNPPEQ